VPSASTTPFVDALALAAAIGPAARDVREHGRDVSRLADGLALRLRLEPEVHDRLVAASLLHDLGKVAIGDEILLKPGALTRAERQVVQRHPEIGARLVARRPDLRPLVPAILHHHERWDGAGYPAGLGGGDIPLEARVIGVVDAFAAMLSDRPYSAAVSPGEACDELERCAGGQFDPTVVEAFVADVRPA
jgi:HD-GYP domain-containing protein (c-di-GMP phosphodiesterase class II)